MIHFTCDVCTTKVIPLISLTTSFTVLPNKSSGNQKTEDHEIDEVHLHYVITRRTPKQWTSLVTIGSSAYTIT
jgi:hypothetical protein